MHSHGSLPDSHAHQLTHVQTKQRENERESHLLIHSVILHVFTFEHLQI